MPWHVIKIGGDLAQDRPKLAATIGAAVREKLEAKTKVAVVHGAGPQATELTKKLGLEPTMIAGRRLTDDATLEVMKMTLGGQVSVDVAAAFRIAGVPAVCTTGVSAGIVDARKRPPRVISGAGDEPIDLGQVGDVTGIAVDLLEKLASIGLVPVLGSLAGDSNGAVFNINADTVAARVAAALGAEKLYLVSNVPGVLQEKTTLATLTRAESKQLIETGVITAGMIPKVEEAFALLDEVKSVVICDATLTGTTLLP